MTVCDEMWVNAVSLCELSVSDTSHTPLTDSLFAVRNERARVPSRRFLSSLTPISVRRSHVAADSELP